MQHGISNVILRWCTLWLCQKIWWPVRCRAFGFVAVAVAAAAVFWRLHVYYTIDSDDVYAIALAIALLPMEIQSLLFAAICEADTVCFYRCVLFFFRFAFFFSMRLTKTSHTNQYLSPAKCKRDVTMHNEFQTSWDRQRRAREREKKTVAALSVSEFVVSFFFNFLCINFKWNCV